MPKHENKVEPTFDYGSRGSAAEFHDTPGRVDGTLDPGKTTAADHDLDGFDAALRRAVADGVPYGVLRRHVELAEWSDREAI